MAYKSMRMTILRWHFWRHVDVSVESKLVVGSGMLGISGINDTFHCYSDVICIHDGTSKVIKAKAR